jgi:hypothetical protein
MNNERNFEQNPYSADEKKVAEYLWELTDGTVGGGDDPIGFLIASHNILSEFYQRNFKHGN